VETVLTGLTWDHPRGYAPLIGGAAEYEKANPGLKIRWDRRTLREFGEAPIERYIDRYDLLIVDHPFVGYAAAHGALVNLASLLSEVEKLQSANDSVGPSWKSYWYGDGLWALPIDAATQVASYRPDLLQQCSLEVPRVFDDVLRIARRAREFGKFMVVPACPTDAISLFFTISANLGHPIEESSEIFVADAIGRDVLERLHSLVSAAHPKSVEWNPIQVYDFMISTSDAIYCPYGFGYSNYSRADRLVRLKFADAPAGGTRGCAGTMLGGTGVAISKKSAQQGKAVEYAKWLVSRQHQCGRYFYEGGQPASLAAWTDPALDAAAGGFFSGTLQTLQTAYLRPRFDGFVRFFESAGIEINRCLRGLVGDADLIAWLNARYAIQRAKSETT
jgi:multiple sugar transport system substrate-binding protein